MPAPASTPDIAFNVRGVSRTFGATKALDRVDLTVAAGEMVALIGASGSGKSTLLRTLTGLTRTDPGPGGVCALGREVQADGRLGDDVRTLRSQVGFIFQQFNLVPRLSLYSNVLVGALPRVKGPGGLIGLWPKAEQARAMAVLARVGVAEQAGQRAGALSGGQQQRGAIARTLVQGARAILADEPIASLDPVSARRIMAILRELNRTDGLTVIVTLHQVEYALRYCPRTVALKGGRIVYDGPSSGLARELLADVYGPDYEDPLGEGAPP